MGIYNKIEEIRRKPENIRLRYVWITTIISMFFIIFIWVFSLLNQKAQLKVIPSSANQQSIINEFQQQKKSILKTTQEINQSLKSKPLPNQSNADKITNLDSQ